MSTLLASTRLCQTMQSAKIMGFDRELMTSLKTFLPNRCTSCRIFERLPSTGSRVLTGAALAFFSASLLVGHADAAELFKCRSKNGQILYSDAACDKSGAALIGTIEQPRNPQANGQSSPGSSKRPPANLNPHARRSREDELKPILENPSSTLEQKAAAQEELTSIASSGVCKLSDEERKKREEAYADLGGARQGRAAARGVLRQMLRSCERV